MPLGFQGADFDGNGKTIANLIVSRSTTDDVGLFGAVSAPTIHDLTLSRVGIRGQDTVGAVVSRMGAGTLSNINAAGTVSGRTYVGGLLGNANAAANISGSTFAGTVTGSDSRVGGLLGYGSTFGTISNSHVAGTIQANTNTAGGLIGELGAVGARAITSSYSTGQVSAGLSNNGDWVGGLIGYAVSATIQTSYSEMNVLGATKIGGLVGYMGGGSITSSYAGGTAAVTALAGPSGGLVGSLVAATLSKVYATQSRKVYSSGGGIAGVGGLVGEASGGATLLDCYSAGGTIASTTTVLITNAGGIVGSLAGGAGINRCYSLSTSATIQGTNVGSLVGSLVGTLTDSFGSSFDLSSLVGTGGGLVLTSSLESDANLKKQSTFPASWLFDTIWTITEGSSYPTLR